MPGRKRRVTTKLWITRALLLFAVVVGIATAYLAKDVYTHGYLRSDGTYLAPHYRSAPDGNFYNNWRTWPNINPYSGRIGTRCYPRLDYGLWCYGRYRGIWNYPSYSYRYNYGHRCF